jgi:hypothetical protein
MQKAALQKVTACVFAITHPAQHLLHGWSEACCIACATRWSVSQGHSFLQILLASSFLKRGIAGRVLQVQEEL